MPATPQSDTSHDSDGEPSATKQGRRVASKDKECPYCQQRFTSSSLGRHLDQYLFKKRPDGVHNVDEIRRQRGGITRRTPKHGAVTKRDREGSQPTRTSSLEARGTPPATVDLLNGKPPGGMVTKINAMDWHSTGVINDLDAHRLLDHTPIAATPTGTKRNWATYETGQRDALDSRADTGGDKDTVRALELSLREVLDSLQAATYENPPLTRIDNNIDSKTDQWPLYHLHSARVASTQRSSPLDFDIQAQTFPSLCLLLLHSPPTLFSTAPFPTATSFPLDPPSAAHLDALTLKLQTVIRRWKWEALSDAQRASYPNSSSAAANLGAEHDLLSRTAQRHEDTATRHLELAYAAWTDTSPEQRARQWQLELARAFVAEQEKRREAEERLERVQQEASQLQAQVEMLSRCQWPREMALWPPERVPVGKDVLRELRLERKKSDGAGGGGGGEGGAALRDRGRWDFDTLVGKWKRVVREDKSRRTGTLGHQQHQQHQRPSDVHEAAPLPPQHQPPHSSSLMAGLEAHAAEAQSTAREGDANGEEPMRRNGRPHVATGSTGRDDPVREVNGALMTNGDGKG